MAEQAKAKGGRRSGAAKGTAAPRAPMLGKGAKADLPREVFGEDFHESLVHEAARADLAARRRGTASSLGRGDVSMTTAKAWRQKGTGRARVGPLSVPHRRGGGAAFGPTPRDYAVKVNRKARRRAMRAALSVHASRDTLAVVDAASFDEPSTKRAAEALDKWGAERPTLVVLTDDEVTALKSFRNLPRVTVVQATAAGVADLISNRSLVLSQTALETLTARATGVDRGASGSRATARAGSAEESERSEDPEE